MVIPEKTKKLLDKLCQVPVEPKAVADDSIPPLRGPWAICPPPGETQRDCMHLFKLTVVDTASKKWKIEVQDLNSGKSRIHASGFKANLKMDGQIMTGEEFFDRRRPEEK